MPARLPQTRTKSRRHLPAFRKTRQAIFESLEHKYLMAFDSVAGVDYSRSLEVPLESSSAESAALRYEITDAQNRAKLLADSLHSDNRDPNAPYSSQLMHYGEAAKASGTVDIGLANQAAWQDWSESLKNSGTDSKVESSLLALTDPIRQLSSSWSAQKGTDSVDLLRESPVSYRSQSIDDAGGFDPSKVWVGASLVSDRRTFALFQPISVGAPKHLDYPEHFPNPKGPKSQVRFRYPPMVFQPWC